MRSLTQAGRLGQDPLVVLLGAVFVMSGFSALLYQVVWQRQLTLVLGSTVLALMPWNAPLWLMAKRLRLAIEVDCDRRVLREDHCDVQTYGSLLVDVGRRKGGVVYAGAGFSWARSLLEHRILQMTARSGGRRSLRAGGLLMGLALVLLTAGFMPKPPSMQALAARGLFCEGTRHAQTQVSDQATTMMDWRS